MSKPMCIFIQDTVTNLYLSYDAATGTILWVVGTGTATCFTPDTAAVVLALLNTSENPNQFVGRPDDRAGHPTH